MTYTLRRSALLLIASLLSTTSGRAQPVVRERLPVGPGVLVEHWHDPEGAWRAWVTRVDLDNPHVDMMVRPAAGAFPGLERPSAFCLADPSAVVAINGDYFEHTGLPIGLCVTRGRLLKTGRGWSYLALLTDGRAAIGRGEPRISAVVGARDTVVLGGLNPPRPRIPPYLADHAWVAATGVGHDQEWLMVELEKGLPWPSGQTAALVKRRGSGNPTVWDDGDVMLLADRQCAIEVGSRVELIVQTPDILRHARDTVGGGPRILRSGRLSVEYQREGTSRSHALDRHPRSAVGISRNGAVLWLVVVDGRCPGHSRGVDLAGLGSFMLKLGCWDALNLDGGGSSIMVFRGEPLGLPSDVTGERPVANLLVVSSRNPPGPALRAIVGTPPSALACGAWWRPDAWWCDEAGWVLGRATAVSWECDASLGTLTPDGFIWPRGDGWLRVRAEAVEGSTWVRCHQPAQVGMVPPVVVKRSLESPLVMCRDAAGAPLTVGYQTAREEDYVKVRSGVLGTWRVPVIDTLSWEALGPATFRFVEMNDRFGLPFEFSSPADTTVLPLRPSPGAASLRLEVLGTPRCVHLGVSFADSAGHSYRGEITSPSGGAYWEGWRSLTVHSADCTQGDRTPAVPPVRLDALLLWPHPAHAMPGTLWVRSPAVGVSSPPGL